MQTVHEDAKFTVTPRRYMMHINNTEIARVKGLDVSTSCTGRLHPDTNPLLVLKYLGMVREKTLKCKTYKRQVWKRHRPMDGCLI